MLSLRRTCAANALGRGFWVSVLTAVLSFLWITAGSSGSEFDFDYSADIKARRKMLERIAESDYPRSAVLLGRLLQTGGPLALRDLLVFMGDKKPDLRAKLAVLPLSFGKQHSIVVRDAKGKERESQIVRPNLADVVVLEPLRERGFLSDEREYTYYELARVIERTLFAWRIFGSETDFYSMGNGGGRVFTVDPQALLAEPSPKP